MLVNRRHVLASISIRMMSEANTKDLALAADFSCLNEGWVVAFECSASLVTHALNHCRQYCVQNKGGHPSLEILKVFDESVSARNVLAPTKSIVRHSDFDVLAWSSQLIKSALKSLRASGKRGLLSSKRSVAEVKMVPEAPHCYNLWARRVQVGSAEGHWHRIIVLENPGA